MSSPPPPPPPPPPPSPDYYYYMVVTIAVIIVVLVGSNIATFACHRRRPIVNPRIVAPRSRIEDRIPVTKYMKDCARDTDEPCAVCLAGFVEGEELRQLPGCMHTFHAPCIDMWLYSHSTCPLCRRTVMALPPLQRCPAVDAAGMQAEAQPAPVSTEASNMGQLVVAIV